MVLAELQLWHSRPIAPTRRVALGDCLLPTDPVPGLGGLLLGAVVARFSRELDEDDRADVGRLMSEVRLSVPIGQPRLRHRYQSDRIGLTRSRHRVVDGPDGLRFELETAKASAAQSVLAAVYAAEDVPEEGRGEVVDVLQRGLDWTGPVGTGLIDHLVGLEAARRFRSGSYSLANNSVLWAFDILGIEPQDDLKARTVQRHYRALLRDAHPDHGGGEDGAADRIATLARAREILLSA